MLDISFRGAIYSCSGYARIRHLLVELSKIGVNVKTYPFNLYDDINFKDIDILRSLEKTSLLNNYINLSVGIPLQFFKDPHAKFNIGYTMFETTPIPSNWLSFCNNMDEVWVPSIFCKKSFDISGVKTKLHIVPLGIDENLFYQREYKPQNVFNFLAVGTYIDRKGWDILINAYTAEFKRFEKVKLIIKLDATNNFAVDEIKSLLKPNSPEILICNSKLNDNEMVSLYNMSHCFVLPTRGEAFCVPALESLALGIPVIITDEGGYRDFIGEDNAWLVKSDSQRISSRLGKINTYYQKMWFREVGVDDLRKAMREAFENKEEYLKKKENAKKNLEKFYFSNIAKELKIYLEQMEKKICN
jgi:glycosyltransferase involved in cell wall biosynthesis